VRPITLLPGRFAVCRLPAGAPWPSTGAGDGFVSITATADELSLILPENDAPPDARASNGWRCLKIEGPFELSETGILAPLAAALAARGVTLLPVATFDTDYLTVRDETLAAVIEALEQTGCIVTADPSSPS
jgi:hypothetical protein